MKNPKNQPAKLSEAIVKSTREWLAQNNTAIIFAKDGDTIEDVAPEVIERDLVEYGY